MPITNGVLHPVQIVEDVWRAQELQQPKARVPGQVDERDRVPPDRDFDDDDADLGERGVGQRRLHVALDARRDAREQRRRHAENSREPASRRRLLEERRGAQQQKASGMNRERSVVDRARRRRSLHGTRQPLEKGSNALLPATATMSRMQMIVASVPLRPIVDVAPVRPNRSERLSVPARWRSRTAADNIAASLMRYTENTRTAFDTAAGRS